MQLSERDVAGGRECLFSGSPRRAVMAEWKPPAPAIVVTSCRCGYDKSAVLGDLAEPEGLAVTGVDPVRFQASQLLEAGGGRGHVVDEELQAGPAHAVHQVAAEEGLSAVRIPIEPLVCPGRWRTVASRP